ncbi:MAG: Fur family transcriptional regulator [Bacillota bacterium]
MISTLRQAGLKATPQRLAILGFLQGNTTHPSAEEIYRALKPKFPSLSPATVYNTLEALIQAGVLQEVGIDPARRRVDPNPAPHTHFLCARCGRVYDLILPAVEIDVPDEVAGFRIHRYALNLYGVCRECASGEGER